MHRETKVSGETLFEGHIFRAERDSVLLENGASAVREVARHRTGAACVLCERDGRIAFVRQYRYVYGLETLELPAGKKEPGESYARCAVRELKEETGLTAGKLYDLGEIYPSPGWMEERLHLFAAEISGESEASPDEDEFLDLVWLTPEEALTMAAENRLPDAKTQIALLKWYYLRQNGLSGKECDPE